MFTVYVLRDKNGKVYKGQTNNLSRRISEHIGGRTFSTSYLHDLQVVYTEEYATREEAVKREKYLKTAAGRKFLKQKMRV
jgi:putative endonuclease